MKTGSPEKKSLRVNVQSTATPVLEAEVDMRRTFNLFDEDGSGFISPDEFRSVMRKLRRKRGMSKISDEEVEKMIDMADADHDGEICYEE